MTPFNLSLSKFFSNKNMSLLKKLAGETVIYGLTTVVGRLLNYLLVPIHTRIFLPGEYGVVTEIFAYAGFLAVLFSYRFESAYFRYATQEKTKSWAFATAMRAMFATAILMTGVMLVFSEKIAVALQYVHYKEVVAMMALTLGCDAVCVIPFAKLRISGRAKRFGMIKLINIGTNIFFNIFFLVICRNFIPSLYSPEFGIGYIFLSNLLASMATFIMLLPIIIQSSKEEGAKGFNGELWNDMMAYSMPLMLAGFAGIANEVLDRILLKWYLVGDIDYRMSQIGIYGACYKLAILMTLFTQAFNYASEPFFFQNSNREDSKHLYAQVAKAYTIVGSLVFLLVTLYMDVAQIFIGEKFREGVHVVPILLLANLFLGLYYSLSVWFKVTDRTRFGTYIALMGAAVTIILNITLIPVIGFTGSAWATLACYGLMLGMSWWWGQKYYPVDYPLKDMFIYIGLAVAVYMLSVQIHELLSSPLWLRFLINTLLMGGSVTLMLKKEGISPKETVLKLIKR